MKEKPAPVAPPPVPAAPKPAAKRETLPPNPVERSNANSYSPDFRLSTDLKRSLNGGAQPAGDDVDAIPSSVLAAPTDAQPPEQPAAMPAIMPPPAAAAVPSLLAPDNTPSVPVRQRSIDSLPNEFKLPDTLRKSLDATPGGPVKSAPSTKGLNSLPSGGLIQQNDE